MAIVATTAHGLYCSASAPLLFTRTTTVVAVPGLFVRLKTVVLSDPRVHLDAAPLLLPEKPGHEGPGHLEWVRRVHELNNNLGK